MRRILLVSVVAALLLAGFFLVYFSASGFRRSNQSFLTSLSDFTFMVDSYRRQFAGGTPPELNEESFAAVMQRFRPHTHWEVREWALIRLKQWGQAAGPWLEQEVRTATDPYRLTGTADALVAIQHPRAVELIGELLELYVDDLRRFRSDFVDALGETGSPEAAVLLIDAHRRYGNSIGSVLDAIGKCGGTEFLLERLAEAGKAKEILDLIWPLAYTRDPRAAAAVAELLRHRDPDVRVRAYSAMGQSMGAEVVDPVIAVMRTTGDEYILSAALNQVLARGINRGHPRLVPFLTELVEHPTLGWDARYALARVGGPEAVAALEALFDRERPEMVMEHLDYLGNAAHPILRRYLQDADSRVRRQALFKAEELLDPALRPDLEPLLDDPDPYLRRQTRRVLFEFDRLDLLRSYTLSLPEGIGRGIWKAFRQELSWGFNRGYRSVLTIFQAVHWAGIILSGLLGLLLVLNRVRIFEAYRFTLFLSFLLVEGLLGNYFFLGSELDDPQRVFQLATGAHLLLLIGYLYQERELLPGELRSRFERLGGASLWLLAPLLLWFGTPLLASGLRLVLRDYGSFLPYVGMTLATQLLVLEQWAIPRRLFRRTARFERLLTGILTAGSLALFAFPLWLMARRSLGENNGDTAALAGVLLAVLGWMLLYRFVHLAWPRLGTPSQPVPSPPNGRLEAFADGERITVRPRPRIRPKRALAQALAVFAVGGLAAYFAGRFGGGGAALHLALLAGLAGAALAALLFEALAPRVLLQVRAGRIRAGITRLGATLGDGAWRRRPILSPAVKRHLAGAGDPPLTSAERDWLMTLQELGAPPAGQPASALLPREVGP